MRKSEPARADRRAFLGMPGYGQLTAGAGRGFWRATRLPDRQVTYQYNEGSLLAANFNQLWCAALNRVRDGERVDYFAMQHADVEPEDLWLDTLIDELEAEGLDVLGCAVPIKDHKGLTSLALDRPDRDTWRPLCRLTMAEVRRLPETFTSEDVGAPLLLNTGLWVCRFDERWARQVRFTINDRIAVTPDGRYAPQCEPEDWYFSRLCHGLGLRLGATRKVRLVHRGGAAYPSTETWGEPFDLAYLPASVVPEPAPAPAPAPSASGFVLPDIDGWLRPEEGAALAELARGKRVLEVGSYLGLSTVCMARTAETVVSVDPHDGRGTEAPRRTLRGFRENLERHGVADKVVVVEGTLGRAPRGGPWPVPNEIGERCYAANASTYDFDLAFIDGDHSEESVQHDIDCALDRLAPDGLLAFHDYRSPVDPGVAAAVDELLRDGGALLSLTGTLAVVRPPAPAPNATDTATAIATAPAPLALCTPEV